MSKFGGPQYQVYTKLEDLKEAAIPREYWGRLPRVSKITWPWGDREDGAKLDFSLAPTGTRAHLWLELDLPKSKTHLEFQPSGRLLHVDRFTDDVILRAPGAILLQRAQELVLPSARPDRGDYQCLIDTLEQGTFFYRHVIAQEGEN